MMSNEDRKIFIQFANQVCQKFPEARLWVFGSRARGDAEWNSDLNVSIVLEKVENNADEWIRNVAWEIGFENDLVITTVVASKEQFEPGPLSESTLVANVLREGVTISGEHLRCARYDCDCF